MSETRAPVKVKTYTINHPQYGTVPVIAEDEGEAIYKAAQMWGVPFRKLAAYCSYTFTGEMWQCVCARCKKEFPSPTGVLTYCPVCTKIIADKKAKQDKEIEIKKAAARKK